MKINEIADWLEKRVFSSSFQAFLTDSLVDLCLIDNTPQSDLKVIGSNEDEAIRYLSKLILQHVGEGFLEQRNINENIQNDKNFIKPYYTDSKKVYKDRKNLLHFWEPSKRNTNGIKIGLNAHIDTVSPHIDPSVVDGVVYGRGSCDDKGGCINIVATLKLLKEIDLHFGVSPGNSITSMFVIDEETGGNGSLSLSQDKELVGNIDTMIVVEPTNQQIHPANRGAIWYRVEVPLIDVTRSIKLMLKVVLALEETGRNIKGESNHKLFPDRPVQTCQGVFGPYGEHPSRVCDEFELIIQSELDSSAINNILRRGLQKYVQQYGENETIKDHFHIDYISEGLLLRVFGSSGHMAAVDQLDNAIVKAAYLTKELFDTPAVFSLPNMNERSSLVLEGGQGFLPTHTIHEIEKRLKTAVNNAVDEFVSTENTLGFKPEISFNKLRNAAFACDPDSESMRKAIISAELSKIKIKKPISGFPASCDARLFAQSPLNIETLTVGPGFLADAHSNSEKISINDLASSCSFLALFILSQTGALETGASF